MTKSIRVDAEAEEEISRAIDRYEMNARGSGQTSSTKFGQRCGHSNRPDPSADR
jgi:hypothetical protein